MNHVEQELRRQLEDVGTVVDPAGPPVAHLVAAGRVARRRRQRMRVAGGATAAAAAGVVVVATLSLGALPSAPPALPGHQATPSSTPSPSATPSTTASPTATPSNASAQPFLRWVNDLPKGPHRWEPPSPQEGELLWQGKRYELPKGKGTPGGVAYPQLQSRRGVLVVWHSQGFTGAEDWDGQLGWLTRDGSWEAVATGFLRGEALEPDGDRYAYIVQTISPSGVTKDRLVVRDVDDDRELLSSPVPGETLLGWTDMGLITELTGDDGETRVLAHAPHREAVTELANGVDVLGVAATGDRALVEGNYSGDPGQCNEYVAAVDDLEGALWRGCADVLSPDGRYVVHRLTMTALNTGKSTPLAPEAPALSAPGASDVLGEMRWVDATTLEIEVIPDVESPGSSLAIRCEVPTGGCERAP